MKLIKINIIYKINRIIFASSVYKNTIYKNSLCVGLLPPFLPILSIPKETSNKKNTFIFTVGFLLMDTSIRWIPQSNRHLQLVPTILYSLYLTLYKGAKIQWSWTIMGLYVLGQVVQRPIIILAPTWN